MVTAGMIKSLASRLSKAEELVQAGAVFPVAGQEGYSVVRNGDGSQMYLVRTTEGRENCSCPDFQQRQKRAGMPCKHILAAQLLGQQGQPGIMVPTSDRQAGVDLLMGRTAAA